jgi:hypothetical protein
MQNIDWSRINAYIALKKAAPWANQMELWEQSKAVGQVMDACVTALTTTIRAYQTQQEEEKRRRKERLLGYHPRRRYPVV